MVKKKRKKSFRFGSLEKISSSRRCCDIIDNGRQRTIKNKRMKERKAEQLTNRVTARDEYEAKVY